MTPYSSKSNKSSGVKAYRIGKDYIVVEFEGGRLYTYSNRSAGMKVVEQMKELALASKGLSTYISQHQPGYE